MIRLLNGSYDASGRKFRLLIESRKGKPVPENGIMLQSNVFTVEEVQKMGNYIYELTVVTDTLFMGNMDDWTRSWEGTECMCGLNIQAYKRLSSLQKLEYFKELASVNPSGPVSKYITDNIQLCIAMFPANDAPENRLSKLGGLPCAPAGFMVPKDKQGRSALFIGQIHLDEISPRFKSAKHVNGNGILYFFGTIQVRCDGEYHSFGDIVVRYTEQTNDLSEIPLPDDIKEYGVFAETNLLVTELVSLPQDESALAGGLALTRDEVELFWEFKEIVAAYDYFEPPRGDYYDSIRLMGHPQQLQRCILFETVLKRLQLGRYNPDQKQWELTRETEEEAKTQALQWRHLFSFTTGEFRKMSNFKGQFNEHKDGIYNVMIKQDDLYNLHFDNTEPVYQHT